LPGGCRGRVPAPVDVLAEALPGGLPARSLVLLAGEGGSGKSLLAYSLALGLAVEAGWAAGLVLLDDDAGSVLEALESRYGVEAVEGLVSSGRLLLVDAYMPRYGARPLEGVEGVERGEASTPEQLLALLSWLSSRLRGRGCPVIVVDSLNPLLLRHEATVVYELVNAARARIAKAEGAMVVATLHTPTQLYAEIAAVMGQMADVFIVTGLHEQALEAGATVMQLLVKKAKGVPVRRGWIAFTVTEKGFQRVEVRLREGQD